MMAEVLSFCAVSQALPDSGFWAVLCHHQSHVEWVGCSLHDLIQPGFLFVVGAVIPFSIANRRARGATGGSLLRHGLIRALILVILGIAMNSLHALPWRINLQFDDTLAQIGLAYAFAFPLAFLRPSRWAVALIIVLVGYWSFFALYPLPGPDFDYEQVNVSKEWLSVHGLSGFAAHWQINSNPAAALDLWLLNLVPRQTRYIPYKGLTTLNFVPSIGTMILGMMAGNVLRSNRAEWGKVKLLAVAGMAGIGLGWSLGELGICPVVKSIWTPSWVLFSGGWCFLFMSAAYILVDIWGYRKAVLPLIIIGVNSIVAYCFSHVFQSYAFNSFRRVFGWEIFRVFGTAFEPLTYGFVLLAFYFLILFVLYRIKVFVRI
jgi:predicted acyltransferase